MRDCGWCRTCDLPLRRLSGPYWTAHVLPLPDDVTLEEDGT